MGRERAEAFVRQPGTQVGEYIVLDRLGAGGMGVVYAAYDGKLDRKVALKVLRANYDAETFEVARERMLGEGRALGKLSHPNVVAVHDVGCVDGEVYLAMELVDGQTVTQWRHVRNRRWSEVVAVFGAIADGLAAVHDAGLVHRDVKPDNVLVDRLGRARVTDFGLARPHGISTPSLELAERAVVSDSQAATRTDLTQTGARLGTPAYMAPEQLRGESATALSDQFSYCVALWESLYGRRPFRGENWVSLVLSVNNGEIDEPPEGATGREVPQWLRRIVERGLAKDPDERWPSMRALRVALEAGDPQRHRRRTVMLLVAVGGLAAAGAGAFVADRAAHERAIADCDAAGAAIESDWNDTRRSDVVTAFAQVDAKAGADELTAALDRYAEGWAEQRREVCMAANVERTLSADLAQRSVTCLEGGRIGFGSTVDVFAEADEVVVARAMRSVEGISDPTRCRDEHRLLSLPPLPDDPQLRAAVQTVRDDLWRTHALEQTGRYDEGLAIAQTALQDARPTQDLPTLSNAHYRVAVFLEKKGQYEAAVEEWSASFRAAALAGDDQRAAEAASALAFTEGHQLAHHDAGIRWAELAGVYLERQGMTHTLTEANRLDVLAVLYESKGRYDDSVQTHLRSLELRRDVAGEGHTSLAYGQANLAGVLQAKGDLEGARERLEASLKIFEDKLGASNPTTGHVLNMLGGVLAKLGEYDEAARRLAQVEGIWVDALGADHPDVGDVYNAQGDLARSQAKFDEALKLHVKALANHRAALSERHPTIAHTANKLAQVQAIVGRTEDAKRNFELAEDLLRDADDGDLDGVGRAHHGLGTLALAAGDLKRARDHFERSSIAFERHEAKHEKWLHRCKLGLGQVTFAEGDREGGSAMVAALIGDATVASSVRATALAWQTRTAEDPSVAEAARERALALAADGSAELQSLIASRLEP